jgi:hypothetical protein
MIQIAAIDGVRWYDSANRENILDSFYKWVIPLSGIIRQHTQQKCRAALWLHIASMRPTLK